MLKKHIFLFCCFFLLLETGNAAVSPIQPLYQRVLQVPVLAYVTVEKAIVHKPSEVKSTYFHGDGSTTTATLRINSVLKGKMSEKQVDITFENNEGGTTVRYNIDIKQGDKKVLFLNQSDDKKWQLSWGSPYSLNVNEKNQIDLDSITHVSFKDFSSGVRMWVKNVNARNIEPKKGIKNKTYSFLFKSYYSWKKQFENRNR